MITSSKDSFRTWLMVLSTMSATFLVLALLTGFLLAANYVPSGEAYLATQEITEEVSFGWLVRGIHWWASSLTLIASMTFTAVAYWVGLYEAKDRWLWWSGLGIGLTLLAGNVTGYYLPMDQTAFWRLQIEAQLFAEVPILGEVIRTFLLNGSTFSGATVARIHWLHTLVIPVLAVVALVSHIYAAKKAKAL